jgi:hypothetical protein
MYAGQRPLICFWGRQMRPRPRRRPCLLACASWRTAHGAEHLTAVAAASWRGRPRPRRGGAESGPLPPKAWRACRRQPAAAVFSPPLACPAAMQKAARGGRPRPLAASGPTPRAAMRRKFLHGAGSRAAAARGGCRGAKAAAQRPAAHRRVAPPQQPRRRPRRLIGIPACTVAPFRPCCLPSHQAPRTSRFPHLIHARAAALRAERPGLARGARMRGSAAAASAPGGAGSPHRQGRGPSAQHRDGGTWFVGGRQDGQGRVGPRMSFHVQEKAGRAPLTALGRAAARAPGRGRGKGAPCATPPSGCSSAAGARGPARSCCQQPHLCRRPMLWQVPNTHAIGPLAPRRTEQILITTHGQVRILHFCSEPLFRRCRRRRKNPKTSRYPARSGLRPCSYLVPEKYTLVAHTSFRLPAARSGAAPREGPASRDECPEKRCLAALARPARGLERTSAHSHAAACSVPNTAAQALQRHCQAEPVDIV